MKLDPAVYFNEIQFKEQRRRLLVKYPQWLGQIEEFDDDAFTPVDLAVGESSWPLLVHRGGDELRVFVNLCSHRAMRLANEVHCQQTITCPYHGRQFDPKGCAKKSPGFETLSPEDDLRSVEVLHFRDFLWIRGDDVSGLEFMESSTREFPWERLRVKPSTRKVYSMKAHWAFYVENYLEGLHIPFVHPKLNAAIDWQSYSVESFNGGVLQQTRARQKSELTLPGSRDLAAMYFYVFPFSMINIYPWGVSMNRVIPCAYDQTKVEFVSYIWDESTWDLGAGSGLDAVELEDEAVVEAVHQGLASGLGKLGRLSPEWEGGVAHFREMFLSSLNFA